ncbi:hypothetical protein [Burkholderia sp.]|uniref:hypothetical protein n=1 Tax=Burkholderia sp. TaxID=36773 RepID=UPI002585AAD4|nr:hypothetical protein [Burkholderia sp.]MCL4631575.1 hypothetical protein [Burkholderia sp.]
MTDPNHDIVPTLRMFDGVMTGLAADEIERLRERVAELEAGAPAETRDLPMMRNAFRVTEVSGDPDPAKRSFAMRFSFPSIEALHAADDEWNKFIAAAQADAPAEARPTSFHFHRFVDGQKMAEDVLIERERTLDAAIWAAVRSCPKRPLTVLVHAPALRDAIADARVAQADAREGLTDEQRDKIERAEECLRNTGRKEDREAANGLLDVLTEHPILPESRASAGVIAAARALIEADRAQTLTTEHVNALDNAIKIQHGELTLPEPHAEASPGDLRDGTRWRALMKNGEPEVFVERRQRRAIQRTSAVTFSSPNLTGADRFDTPSEMWVKRYVMFTWWARENEHRKFIEAVDAISAGEIQ